MIPKYGMLQLGMYVRLYSLGVEKRRGEIIEKLSTSSIFLDDDPFTVKTSTHARWTDAVLTTNDDRKDPVQRS